MIPKAIRWVCQEKEKPEIPEEIAKSLKYHVMIGPVDDLKYACYCRNYSIHGNKIKLEGVLNYYALDDKNTVWFYHELTEFYNRDDPVSVYSPPQDLASEITVKLKPV